MKIAILTLPFHVNYGGVLQAYALQTVLQRMGHEVVVIDKDSYYHRPWWRQQVALAAYMIRKYLLRQDVEYVNLRRLDREKKAVENNVREFVNRHLNIVVVKDLQRDFPKDVDAIVVGSDQVWRKKYFIGSYGCSIDNAFLSFCSNDTVKRIAYAVSFGTDEWEYTPEETSCCACYLKLFDAVSMREKSGVFLCQEKLHRTEVVRLPDPTLLLSREDYRFLYSIRKKDVPYMFYYVLDETDKSKQMAASIARDRGLEIKRISGDVDDSCQTLQDRIKAPVENWLSGVSESAFVYTDSFHACVFSILFGKPFLVIGNKSRGMDRIYSLLSTYSLEHHLMGREYAYDSHSGYEIPSGISEILKEEKSKAMDYLKVLL